MVVSGQNHAQDAWPRKKNTGTHWIGSWVGPRAGLDDVENRKASKINLYLQGVNWNEWWQEWLNITFFVNTVMNQPTVLLSRPRIINFMFTWPFLAPQWDFELGGISRKWKWLGTLSGSESISLKEKRRHLLNSVILFWYPCPKPVHRCNTQLRHFVISLWVWVRLG
jgi:hypothetical protein